MPMPETKVAPDGRSPIGLEQREKLADFLALALMKPLHHSHAQHRLSVEQSLNTMSHSERVYLEIEMTERAKVMHSYDYDALR
jgi:hypothetical protein